MIRRILFFLILLATVSTASAQKPTDTLVRSSNVSGDFPRPTAAALDSLLQMGIVPKVLEEEYLRPMYWPRSAFVVVGRALHRSYMTQALDGGFGLEGNIAIPFGATDNGYFLYARANAYKVVQPAWLGWRVEPGQTGILFNGGGGINFGIPMRHPQISFPLSLSVGAAFFQSRGELPAETYLAIEPSLGLRYRFLPAFALLGRAQAGWMTALNPNNRNIGSWSFSFGLEVALALQRKQPLQYWVPPLVVNAQDLHHLLSDDTIPPVNILDRNLDFINTELKPWVAFGWYDLGFYGTVRGTVVATSRASSGNVTAVDVMLDSGDVRGFVVDRIESIVNRELAESYRSQPGAAENDTSKSMNKAERRKIDLGKTARRTPDVLGVKYIRAEMFPQSKGELNQVPKVGSRVVIRGDLRWDGDGHIELHPRRPSDTRVVTGEFLDSYDDAGQE